LSVNGMHSCVFTIAIVVYFAWCSLFSSLLFASFHQIFNESGSTSTRAIWNLVKDTLIFYLMRFLNNEINNWTDDVCVLLMINNADTTIDYCHAKNTENNNTVITSYNKRINLTECC